MALGFHILLQYSVFIYPWNCVDSVHVIGQVIETRLFVLRSVSCKGHVPYNLDDAMYFPIFK